MTTTVSDASRVRSRLFSALPLSDALACALSEARIVLQAEAVALALSAPGGKLRYLAAVGPGAAAVLGATIPDAPSASHPSAAVFDLVADTQCDRRRYSILNQLAGSRVRGLAASPLHIAGQTIGTLEVVNPMRRGAFSEADRPHLEAFAQLFAVAVVQHGAHADLGLPAAARLEIELRRRWGGWSPISEAFLGELHRLGATGRPYLLAGEPGSGRERAAWALHRILARPGAAFVVAKAPSLALYATSGAAPDPWAAPLLTRLALGGGTLFIAELDAVPPQLVAGLGHFLRALGEAGKPPLQIAAAVGPGDRGAAADLAPLFGSAIVRVPPLSARATDVPALTGDILRSVAHPLSSRVLGFEPEALELLSAEPWRRNVESLRRRIAAVCLASESAWVNGDELSEYLLRASAPSEADARDRALALADPRPRVRIEAVRELEVGGPTAATTALPALLAALEDPVDLLRVRIVRLLGAHPDRRAVKPLADRLVRETDPVVRRELLTALGRLGASAAVEPVLRHVRDRDPDIRAAALLALGRLGGERARQAAEEMAEDPDPRVRATALGAIHLIDSASSLAGDGEAPAPMQARLVLHAVGGEPTRYELSQAALTIGRTTENTISLAYPSVSKRHAVVVRAGADWVLRDEGSTNGTRVNGIKIGESVLAHGDEIQIGPCDLRFEEEPLPAAASRMVDDLESTLFGTVIMKGPAARQAIVASAGGGAGLASSPPARGRGSRPEQVSERLLAETRTEDWQARRWAARVLGDLGQGVTRLVELLEQDPDQEVRLEATRALGKTRAPSAVQPLLARLEDRMLRIAAIEALGALAAPEAVDPLAELLRNERNSRVRRAAVRALGQIGELRAVPSLTAALTVPNLAADAIASLIRIGGSGATSALAAHLDPSDPLCPEAVRGLGVLRAEAMVPKLVPLLVAEDELLVVRTVEALAAIGRPAIDALLVALTIPAQQAAALRALAAMADPGSAAVLLDHAAASRDARLALRRMRRQALPALFKGLEREPETASRILASMPESESEAVVEHLTSELLQSDVLGRWVVPLLIVHGAPAIEPLRKAASAGAAPANVRVRALEALGHLATPRAVPELLAAITEPGRVGMQALASAAGLADPEIARAIAARWTELSPTARTAAVAALVPVPAESDAGSTSGIEPALSDLDPHVRCAAALTIATWPHSVAAPLLARLAFQDEDPQVRTLAAALGRGAGWLKVTDLQAAIADPARPPAERAARARVLDALDGGPAIDAAVDLLLNGPEPAVERELTAGLERQGTAVLLRLAARPDGEASASAPALARLWPALEFRPELAPETMTFVATASGSLRDRMREHLAAHAGQVLPELIRRLSQGASERDRSLVQAALLALRPNGS